MSLKAPDYQPPPGTSITSNKRDNLYQFKARIDFTHCEQSWCRNCSAQQQRHCENEAAEILNKFPQGKVQGRIEK